MEPTESARPVHDEAAARRAGRLRQLRAGLVVRMRPVCQDIPDALFEKLIDQMVLTRLRDEELGR